MSENTQTQMDFGDSYKEAMELQRQVMAAEDARKAKRNASETETDIEHAFANVVDETRQLTLDDLAGQRKMIVGKRPMGPKSGEDFALKLNTEFSTHPAETKELIRGMLAEITGIPWVQVNNEEDQTLGRIAKELGDNPKLYIHPNEFKTLKDFLASHEIGIGLAQTKTGKPTEEDLNRASMELMELLEKHFEIKKE